MSDVLDGVELCVREECVPDQFRAVVQGGWTVENGAHVLTALYSNYSGAVQSEFGDVVHFEATVNGRGMMDYDLPDSGPERLKSLLDRSLAYACTALLAAPVSGPWPVLGYISLSEGGIDDNLLTAHVTFCTRRVGLPPFVQDMDSYTHEALMEISQRDAPAMLARNSPSSGF
ncbi:hypothetical protein ABZT02_06055 [Streptomyces sp. NPDC005402]|uniref:hypothetical protein n=1 Tax=Streptomyces sp. NPDC005402 TaxID=3155338 RepID=UPI0033AB2C5F